MVVTHAELLAADVRTVADPMTQSDRSGQSAVDPESL